MDTFYTQLYQDIFYQWVLQQKPEFDRHHISIEIKEDENKKIIYFHLVNAFGIIKIWHHSIVEEEIQDLEKEPIFYLHFSISNIKQCVYLFNEFFKALLQYHHQTTIKIALCCSGGLSTSLFSTKLAELVKIEKLNYTFDAIGFYRLARQYDQYDAILLAPQIAYLEPTALMVTHHSVPIYCIEPIDFATNNYHRILTQLNQLELSIIRK